MADGRTASAEDEVVLLLEVVVLVEVVEGIAVAAAAVAAAVTDGYTTEMKLTQQEASENATSVAGNTGYMYEGRRVESKYSRPVMSFNLPWIIVDRGGRLGGHSRALRYEI